MIKKLNPYVVIFECLGLFFIGNAAHRLYFAYYGQVLLTAMYGDQKSNESHTNMTIGDVLAYDAYFTLASLLLGIIIVGILNRKNKIDFINSLAVLVLSIALALTGTYYAGLTYGYLNSFCSLFSDDYRIAFYIGGSIFLIVGLIILWKTISLNKNTVHNTTYNA